MKVTSRPQIVGRGLTLDMEVGAESAPTHSYQVISATGKKLVTHNTVSLLAGATPGVHYPISKYYIRRMRLSSDSELIGPLKEAGLHIEDCVFNKGTSIVSFPIELEGEIRTEHEVTMWEKLWLVEFLQKHWADNQVSATITFHKTKEGPQIPRLLDYAQYSLKSISFLPYDDNALPYPQMPYEVITKEQYEVMVKNVKPINFAGLKKTTAEVEIDRFCDGETCLIGEAAREAKLNYEKKIKKDEHAEDNSAINEKANHSEENATTSESEQTQDNVFAEANLHTEADLFNEASFDQREFIEDMTKNKDESDSE